MKDKKIIKKLAKQVNSQATIQTALLNAIHNLARDMDDLHKRFQDASIAGRELSPLLDIEKVAHVETQVRWCVRHNQLADGCDHPNTNGDFEFRDEKDIPREDTRVTKEEEDK